MKAKRIILSLIFFSGLCACQPPSSSSPPSAAQPTRETYLKLAAEVEDALHSDVISVWFPRSVDLKTADFTPISAASGIGRPAMASLPFFRVG